MLIDRLLKSVDRRPAAQSVCETGREVTFSQLELFARAIRRIVINKTDAPRVGILLPAGIAFDAAFHGTLWADRVPVPLNFLLSPTELADIAEDAAIDLIFTIHHFDSLTENLPVDLIHVDDLPIRRLLLKARLTPRPPRPQSVSDETAVLLYTSGTTGACKGVELTARALAVNCDAIVKASGIGDHDRFLAVLPPFHVFGLTGNVLVPAASGLPVYAIPRFSAAALYRAIAQWRPTVLMAIPSMYATLLRYKSAPPDAFKGFSMLVSGGEPLPKAVADGFRERFGVNLLEGYGLTETSPVISLNTRTEHRPGTVGKVVPNVEIRIIDDQGKILGPDGDGQIIVRGHSVMKGYFNRPVETVSVLDAEGWFRTGDVGHLDSDGFLHITGRKKEMIIVGGENVFPREVEEVLRRHPAVSDAAVIGIKDASRGEVPAAFVSLEKNAEADELSLRTFAREHLAGYKVPRYLKIVRDLPRGPTGKVLKAKLQLGAVATSAEAEIERAESSTSGTAAADEGQVGPGCE